MGENHYLKQINFGLTTLNQVFYRKQPVEGDDAEHANIELIFLILSLSSLF